MENIFVSYDHAIIREQDKVFEPISTANLNTPNKNTTFKIQEEDSFLNVKKATFEISGQVLQADGTSYPKGSNVILVDNFPGFLFDSICVKKHGKELDRIDNVGRASLIKGTISYSADLSGPTINSGFQSKFSGGGNFSAIGNLSNLCLGFFKDIEYPVYRGGFEINFVRRTDDDALFRDKNDKTEVVPGTGKIVIEELLISIPIVTYKDAYKFKLINDLVLSSKRNEYTFRFKSWQCIEESNITGKTLHKDITNMYTNIHNPLFAIVAFQTGRLNNQLTDPIEFSNCNLKNIWLDIGGMRYPERLLDLDFKKGKFNRAYRMLMSYKNVYNRVHRDLSLMYITPEQFKDTRPFFVIDISRQPSQISGSKSSIILHADFNENVPANTNCYVCLVSGTEFFYDLTNNTIRENI